MKFVLACVVYGCMLATINGRRMQRFFFFNSSTTVQVTPSVEIPYTLTTGATVKPKFKLPITLTFPSIAKVTFGRSQALRGFRVNEDLLQTSGAKIPDIDLIKAAVANTSNEYGLKRLRSAARRELYKNVEQSHSSFGQKCLLRMICEAAEVPFLSPSTGLVGEIIDMMLRSTHLLNDDGELSKYQEAQKYGKDNSLRLTNACKKKYDGCPISVFNIVNLPKFGF